MELNNAQRRLIYILINDLRNLPYDPFEYLENEEELWDAVSDLEEELEGEYNE
jgi:uncharacterized protein (UPF0305 family)